jgi:hypothetical protein
VIKEELIEEGNGWYCKSSAKRGLILKERERLKKIAIINRRNEYQKLKLTTNQKNIYL